MLPLLHFCVSAVNIRKIIFVYQSQRTVAYFMQILRHATDVELRFYDAPVSYLFCIHGLCVAYMLRCCGKLFLCVMYLYCVSLWPYMYPGTCFLCTKIHSKRMRSHCVSSDQAANTLLTCCVTIDRMA